MQEWLAIGDCYPEHLGKRPPLGRTHRLHAACQSHQETITRSSDGGETDMEAEPTDDGCADAREGIPESPLAVQESEVVHSAPRGPLPSVFRRLARFSTHTKRWHAIDRASGGRGDGADDDTPSGER